MQQTSSDVNKDLTFKDKDKDQTLKAEDQGKDCILVLKESLRTRTRTNITVNFRAETKLLLILCTEM